jgi:type II secretory pathway pseudopilin PulG
MKNRIINIVIFVVAILAVIVAIAFSFFSFDAEKKDSYVQVREIEAQTPEMVSDFENATLETLPAVIDKYQQEMQDRSTKLKDVQLEKDILYTYLQDLKNLDENTFETYKANFPARSEALFAKSENKQKYVDGFNGVKTYKDLEGYVNKMNDEYANIKQQYLIERNYIKSANALINKGIAIRDNASASKKATEFEALQTDLKSFGKSASLQNFFITLVYILGLGAAFLMVFFLLKNMVTDFKSSYKILVGLLFIVVVFFIGYLVGTPVLSPSAIKAGMSSSGYKMVNAAVFTVYICLLVAIVSIFATLIMNAVKNKN